MQHSKALYELTDEHRAQMGQWRDRWIANAMSTDQMTEEDRTVCRAAVIGLYAAAKLPPPKNIVFVASPFVLRFAGGFAAAIWWLRKNGDVATDVATYAATYDATDVATDVATRDATSDATWHTDLSATMFELARDLGGSHASLFLACAQNAWNMWNGGNQWSAWVSFLSFFRHIAKLDIPYEAWDHYEVLATRSGPRIMHPDFCIISDRPNTLTVDAQNRPHNDTGPFCAWRDGTALYSVHGIRVPMWLIESPERLTVDAIHAETNAEVRRVMVERYGISRYVRDAQFDVLDADLDLLGQPRRLLRKSDVLVVELTNSTVDADGSRRIYHVPVHPELRPLISDTELGEPQAMTALNAVASTYGLRGEDYMPEVET